MLVSDLKSQIGDVISIFLSGTMLAWQHKSPYTQSIFTQTKQNDGLIFQYESVCSCSLSFGGGTIIVITI